MKRRVAVLIMMVWLSPVWGDLASACQGSHECAFNEYCAVTDMHGECVLLPKRRKPCKAHDDCGENGWCDPLHLICVPDRSRPPSRIGKPCDPDMENYCGSESSCCEVSGEYFCQVDCP